MGRKWELEKSCRAYLNRIRKGSFQTKKTREQIMTQLIDDLASLKRLPSAISEITASHITLLIQYWREKELTEETIVNRLSVFRTVNNLAQLNINIPKNSDLGLKRYVTAQKLSKYDQLEIEKLSHPITRNVFALQMHFGLTQSEAIYLDPNLISHNHALMITRNISHSNKERYIPIIDDAQKNIIEERRSLCDDSFTTIMPIQTINQLIKAELFFLNIKTAPDFRSLYAKKRFAQMGSDEKQAIKTLIREMGITKSKRIYELLATQ